MSHEHSITVEIDGKWWNIPTVLNGRKVSEREAIDHAVRTGKNLGVYDDLDVAERQAAARSALTGLRGADKPGPPKRPADGDGLMPPGVGYKLGTGAATTTPSPSQPTNFFAKHGLGSSFGGPGGFTSGLRDISKAFAAGFSKDPQVRAQYTQMLANEEAMDEQAHQRRVAVLLENSFDRLKMWRDAIRTAKTAGQNPQGLMQHLQKEGQIIGGLMGDEKVGGLMVERVLAEAEIPMPAGDMQLQQLYNPQTKQSMAVNVNDPNAVAQAQAQGFTSLGSPESSDVLSPERLAQDILKSQAGAASTTIINAGPKVLMASDEELLKTGEQSAIQSRSILPMLDIAETAAKNYKATGPGGAFVLDVKRFAGMLGLKSDAATGEVLNSIQQQLAGLQRLPGSGSQSDREFATYLASVPGLLQSQQGNITLARIGRKLIQRRLTEFERLKKHVFETGSSVGFEYNMDPILTEDEFNMIAGAAVGGHSAGGAPPASPPPGWDFVD